MVGSYLRSFAVSGTLAGIVILSACGGDTTKVIGAPPGSSSGNVAPGGVCDPAKCFPGNECLPLDGVTECRKTCSSNDDPATSCPFNYNCTSTDPEAALPPFCVQTTALSNEGAPLEKKETGQWGFPCNASQGSKNPDCDADQNFFCFGSSPSDGNAYCTRYNCEADSECGAGFACMDVNVQPNVGAAKRTAKNIGNTQKICVRRTYCSPCVADVDCTAIEGTKQHCIVDEGGRGFCTPECTSNQGCNNEAKCVGVALPDGSSSKVCYPRSKRCIGDGELCSPCLNDTDCGADGMCTKGQYTTEKFCIKKAPNDDCAQCPKELTSPAARKVGCASKDDPDANYFANYCLPVYAIGGTVGADIGCWTPDR